MLDLHFVASGCFPIYIIDRSLFIYGDFGLEMIFFLRTVGPKRKIEPNEDVETGVAVSDPGHKEKQSEGISKVKKGKSAFPLRASVSIVGRVVCLEDGDHLRFCVPADLVRRGVWDLRLRGRRRVGLTLCLGEWYLRCTYLGGFFAAHIWSGVQLAPGPMAPGIIDEALKIHSNFLNWIRTDAFDKEKCRMAWAEVISLKKEIKEATDDFEPAKMAILMDRIWKLNDMTPTKVNPSLGERDMKHKVFGEGRAATGSEPGTLPLSNLVEAKSQSGSVKEVNHVLVQKSTPQGSGDASEVYASVASEGGAAVLGEDDYEVSPEEFVQDTKIEVREDLFSPFDDKKT
ncbi:hypothetical protein U1Q18_041547, partial [Sarracenia purpurea var. burkii]